MGLTILVYKDFLSLKATPISLDKTNEGGRKKTPIKKHTSVCLSNQYDPNVSCLLSIIISNFTLYISIIRHFTIIQTNNDIL